ncbi:acyl-coenzyme A synthetase/AMP-(fatty) acid ligase [Arthrobacter sp. V4I6]|nr:acyl-coenzyme A synthetase/AMP-(fatty) acid ligase [Arthrobacter sp. V1I7]MDQ0853187.1 acyl-coenzyme A synthetase/AMP-(fatty) acid ligase [Arthrobacter sp. V4I6]
MTAPTTSRVEFIAAAPKSSSGKILRRMLKTAAPTGTGKA